MAATFENVSEPDKIRIDIGAGILDRVTHTRLGSEVHDGVETLAAKQSRHTVAIDDVELLEAETRPRA